MAPILALRNNHTKDTRIKAVAKFRMSEITPKMKVAWCKTP